MGGSFFVFMCRSCLPQKETKKDVSTVWKLQFRPLSRRSGQNCNKDGGGSG